MDLLPAAGALSVRDQAADDQAVAGGYSTGWRSLHCLVFNQWIGSDLRLDLEGGQTLVVPDGQGFLLPSGLRHNLTVTARVAQVRCRWVHLDAWLHGAVDVFTLVRPSLLLDRPAADRLGTFCAELAALRHHHAVDLGAEAQRLNAASRVLIEVLTHCDQSLAGATLNRLRPVLGVLTWMRAHLQKSITRSELARIAGLSPTRFHYVFKDLLGRAPMEHLFHLRLQEAQRLLSEDSLPVQAVAQACGFADPFHFSRRFKTACGLSPQAWRQEFQVGGGRMCRKTDAPDGAADRRRRQARSDQQESQE